MAQHIGRVTLLVRDYDEAIFFYTQKLGFELLEDTDLSGGKRWVVIAPAGAATGLLLAPPADEAQAAFIGNQGGGRVWLFLHTNDFWSDYHRMKAAGVQFLEEPRQEVYATVVVFEDLYGNKWDLLEPANS